MLTNFFEGSSSRAPYEQGGWYKMITIDGYVNERMRHRVDAAPSMVT